MSSRVVAAKIVEILVEQFFWRSTICTVLVTGPTLVLHISGDIPRVHSGKHETCCRIRINPHPAP